MTPATASRCDTRSHAGPTHRRFRSEPPGRVGDFMINRQVSAKSDLTFQFSMIFADQAATPATTSIRRIPDSSPAVGSPRWPISRSSTSSGFDRTISPKAVHLRSLRKARVGAVVRQWPGRADLKLQLCCQKPELIVRIRIRPHSSQRSTSSSGAAAKVRTSAAFTSSWQPVHRRLRSSAAPTPP